MSPEEIKNILNIATWVLVAVIVISAFVAYGYIASQNKQNKLVAKRRWIESLPSFVSTEGVLGTFGGITLGLLFFDTQNLNVSIPLLLSGLKTAFFTSLAGMIGSLLLNRKVASLYDNLDEKGESADQTAYYSAMRANMQLLVKSMDKQNELLQGMNSVILLLKDHVSSMDVHIEQKMESQHQVLIQKFDNLSEIIKKSNTEALVDVMKQLTEDFQKQMGGLIQSLVERNFDQLTQSVERLNLWQQENKEQVAMLIQQYKDMESDMETSSQTLAKVSTDTQNLVGEGGKLGQLVAALNQVMIVDKTYLNVAQKLQETADLTKDNMVKFDDSTSKLNEWVRKQRDFVDSVQMLMAKLEEISKIKDYGGEFWRETKNKMEEGVGFLTNGSQEIEKQLNNLDERFYQRLSSTLAQLDACIQAMVKASKSKTF